MKALVGIDVACNDPDNGSFAGKTMMISYGEMELEADVWEGFRFTVLDGRRFRLHRREFRFIERKFWIGNWCWDRFWMKRPEAKRLIGLLRETGRWRCTQAPCRAYDWFNREGRFTPTPGESHDG